MNAEQSTRLDWFKSSYSSGEGGECVEVAADATAIHVRDSKEHGCPQLAFAPTAWTGFLTKMLGDQ
jgi:hypothetical protein